MAHYSVKGDLVNSVYHNRRLALGRLTGLMTPYKLNAFVFKIVDCPQVKVGIHFPKFTKLVTDYIEIFKRGWSTQGGTLFPAVNVTQDQRYIHKVTLPWRKRHKPEYLQKPLAWCSSSHKIRTLLSRALVWCYLVSSCGLTLSSVFRIASLALVQA